MRVWRPWMPLLGQDASIENARAATTALSRRRVEHEEVDLFMSEYAERRKAWKSA